MSKPYPVFFAVDLETSGLDPHDDRIVEIAWSFLDRHFKPIIHDKPWSTVVRPVGSTLQRIYSDPVVKEMHTQTNLLHELETRTDLPSLGGVEDYILEQLDSIEEALAEFNSDNADEEDFVIELHPYGKNVHFDVRFIERYMPRLFNRLSYRYLDESSIRMFLAAAGIQFEVFEFVEPTAPGGEVTAKRHRAGFDVTLSILMLQSLRAYTEDRENLLEQSGKSFSGYYTNNNGEGRMLDVVDMAQDVLKAEEEGESA